MVFLSYYFKANDICFIHYLYNCTRKSSKSSNYLLLWELDLQPASITLRPFPRLCKGTHPPHFVLLAFGDFQAIPKFNFCTCFRLISAWIVVSMQQLYDGWSVPSSSNLASQLLSYTAGFETEVDKDIVIVDLRIVTNKQIKNRYGCFNSFFWVIY